MADKWPTPIASPSNGKDSQARRASLTRGQAEPVVTPAAAGWLRPDGAVALIEQMFGLRVQVRTVQAWVRRTGDPLPAVMVGGRLMIHRQALIEWVQRVPLPRPPRRARQEVG